MGLGPLALSAATKGLGSERRRGKLSFGLGESTATEWSRFDGGTAARARKHHRRGETSMAGLGFDCSGGGIEDRPRDGFDAGCCSTVKTEARWWLGSMAHGDDGAG
jgi:hypothetical protein